MNELILTKNKHFDFALCMRQICRDSADLRAQMIDNEVVVAIEIGAENCLVSLEDYQNHIQVQVLYKSNEKIDDLQISSYITNFLDLKADLEPFYQKLRNSKENMKFAPIFESARGLRIIGIPDLFQALTWAIIGQQISLAAAFSIKNRFCKTFGKAMVYKSITFYSHPSASDMQTVNIEQLRSVGLSGAKAKYLLNIAKTFANNTDIQLQIEQKSTAEITKFLLSFIGIGKWSCEYVLLKCLRRYDVYPVTDAALITAIKNIYIMEEKPNTDEIHRIFNGWQGWGGYLCFYIWYWHSSVKSQIK